MAIGSATGEEWRPFGGPLRNTSPSTPSVNRCKTEQTNAPRKPRLADIPSVPLPTPTIINLGSSLAYRSVPLQSIYCGAKFAIRGFTDSLRSEILHDGLDIHITMVDRPAVHTPQFDWAILFAAAHHRRQIWVGYPTVQAILANRIAPGLIDKYLAKAGYSGQLSDQRLAPDAPSNLYEAVPGDYGAHGRFDGQAKTGSWEMFTDRPRACICWRSHTNSSPDRARRCH